ncbi:MAG: methylmalonyl Co-A mutase-associated GTPase MeaB [Acidobacteria bacterium]|nr:methylmalonyl Co-A mutase-associated GTPase MeaB [Acidobacteriota bacterium]
MGQELAQRVIAGDVRALARSITLVENDGASAETLLRELYPRAGRAVTIGVTGFPGAGKSSLVDRLIESYRAAGKTVGVIAVDPSSAFSGGAILGDRVRMMRHSGDPGVFIRSMATRGQLGGLSRATSDALDMIDAAGRDVILIETVGVGQDEIDVARLADVVLVVLVPGMGDDIQAIKAGILEIADIFVVNKADRDGADKLSAELQAMMGLVDDARPRPPIVRTIATRGEGLDTLVAAVAEHLDHPDTAGRRAARRWERSRMRLEEILAKTLVRGAIERGVGREGWERIIGSLARREIDPYGAVESILAALPR